MMTTSNRTSPPWTMRQLPSPRRTRIKRLALAALVLAVVATVTSSYWLPPARRAAAAVAGWKPAPPTDGRGESEGGIDRSTFERLFNDIQDEFRGLVQTRRRFVDQSNQAKRAYLFLRHRNFPETSAACQEQLTARENAEKNLAVVDDCLQKLRQRGEQMKRLAVERKAGEGAAEAAEALKLLATVDEFLDRQAVATDDRRSTIPDRDWLGGADEYMRKEGLRK